MADKVVSCSTLGAKKGHTWCFVVEGENLTVLDCKKKGTKNYSCEDVTMRTIPRPLMNAVLAAVAGKPAGATKGRRATGSRRPRNR